jgi:hypothetical protein
VKTFKEQWKVYLLAQAANPPAMKFINGSGLYVNTIPPNTYEFYEEIWRSLAARPPRSGRPQSLL